MKSTKKIIILVKILKNEIIIINKPDVFFDLDVKNKRKISPFIKNLILKIRKIIIKICGKKKL